MLAAGFDVRPTDGSPELAAEASRRLGRPVETLLFHDLDAVETYDGIWANACLLHVPRSELAHVLTLIRRALKPGGHFYASFKAGEQDGRDRLDRYYNYPSPEWLRATYASAGSWNSLAIEKGEVRGFDGEWAEMLFVVARRALLDGVRRAREVRTPGRGATRERCGSGLPGLHRRQHRRIGNAVHLHVVSLVRSGIR